jgi:hypothetical protein
MTRETFDYEPLSLDEQKESFRDDKLELGMNLDPNDDPINNGIRARK